MAILLKFHGALDKVTGSCHFIKIAASENIYAVDCGAAQGEGDSQYQPANPRNLPLDCKPDKLSGIILTHAHGDHISHLPRWFEAGFRGTIFCSEVTAKLAAIALKDSRKIERGKQHDSVDSAFFKMTMEALENATHLEPGQRQTLEQNVTIEAAITSHLLGSCAVRIEATRSEEKSSVLFTGDIGPVEHEDETQSLYAERKRPSLPSDFIVSESTYGNRPRSRETQSGRRRQERVCEVLSKAFRHGDKSVVIIPAFSLQRSLDVLADVFCALHYRRDSIGLSKTAIPLIVVNSGLSREYAQVYRDLYYHEQRDGLVFFNEKSLLHKVARDAEDNDTAILADLLPEDSVATITRHDDAWDEISTELLWGRWDRTANRPTVIICASGMTMTGPIVELMDEYLDKEHATFVLSGYVPGSSPGGELRELWPLSREQRSTKAIRLPEDRRDNRPEKNIPGDEVKCGYESLSEYYSGHADGASIIRYILGDRCELGTQTKGIFLVHGDKSARNDLAQLIKSTCSAAGVEAPPVCRPLPNLPWFDCGACRLTEQTDAQPQGWVQQMSTPSSSELDADLGLPDLIEIEACVVLSNPSPAEEVMEMLERVFDFARPKRFGDEMLLYINRPGRPHGTVKLRASRIGDSLLKVSAESRLMQVETIAEVADAAFDWRQALNALSAPKELYYAGTRWCLTDDELTRLLAACEPTVYDGSQRRLPVIVLHSAMLDNYSLQGLERLLTPSVMVAVVEESSLARINTFLKLPPEHSLRRDNPIYLPLKAAAGAQKVTNANGHLDIGRIASLVTADTRILNAREPQLVSSGRGSALTKPPADEPSQASADAIPSRPKTKLGTDRLGLPLETFMEVTVGQKLTATVEHIQHRRGKALPSFAILRLSEPNTTGILHYTCMAGSFTAGIGQKLEVWIRKVVPENRELFLSQIPVRLPGEQMLNLAKSTPSITPLDIAEVLGSHDYLGAICNAADDSFKASNKQHTPVQPETSLDTPRAVDTYNRAIEELGLVEKAPVAPPETSKALTYGMVASELGYSLQDVVNAAGHMIGDPGTYELGMAVLPGGFAPAEDSPFPADRKEAFIRECLSRSEKGWTSTSKPETPKIQPDCHSVDGLARLMGMPQTTLLARLEAKGIKPEIRVVITPEDIRKLIG